MQPSNRFSVRKVQATVQEDYPRTPLQYAVEAKCVCTYPTWKPQIATCSPGDARTFGDISPDPDEWRGPADEYESLLPTLLPPADYIQRTHYPVLFEGWSWNGNRTGYFRRMLRIVCKFGSAGI